MTIKYEVQALNVSVEYDAIMDAKRHAETLDHASIITWSVERNLPYAKPDYVHRSCGLRVWDKATGWTGRDIFTGHGGAYKLTDEDWTR